MATCGRSEEGGGVGPGTSQLFCNLLYSSLSFSVLNHVNTQHIKNQPQTVRGEQKWECRLEDGVSSEDGAMSKIRYRLSSVYSSKR